MTVLPRRFKKIKDVLNRRIKTLTLLVEDVNKPHNLSAILRTCDAAGVFEANFISNRKEVKTFNSTAQGSQKWVRLKNYYSSFEAVKTLKKSGFQLFGTALNQKSIDYRDINFTQKTCFVLGAEKWGVSEELMSLVDTSIFIPMTGMVQSLNVSVAASILLFEAIRQREAIGIIPSNGEEFYDEEYKKILFEWSYPELINSYKAKGEKYPHLNEDGEIML